MLLFHSLIKFSPTSPNIGSIAEKSENIQIHEINLWDAIVYFE